MSDIRTKPVTPEYEKAWERVFSNRYFVEKNYITEISDSQSNCTVTVSRNDNVESWSDVCKY